jgi:aminomuconate-semialdehyde/2-hydroxymuconate-6-semialdehyde dehydrogenase
MSLIEIKNFIGGEYASAQSKKFIDNFNPATGKIYSTLPRSGAPDVEAAVSAARQAFPAWSRTSPEERSQVLHKIAEGIERRIPALAEAESRDQGKPVWLAETLDIPRAAHNFRFFAGQILFPHNESHEFNNKSFNFSLHKPVGVAGLISPWNLPLYLLSWKIAPAIACGNTVVCKPSEITPMTAFLLCEILTEAGLPPGVVNMVFGFGAEAGEALVKHPKVPLLSFTGGTSTGKHLSSAAAPLIKKLSLELGGKNANIIFADADLDEAIQTSLRSSFLNQGEICLCGSRIFVEAPVYENFVERFVNETRKLKVGDPRKAENFLGALASQAHLEKVRSYVKLAQEEGGKIETGLEAIPLMEEHQNGYFMRPTVITNLASACRVMQEEIFGPVVTLVPFHSEDEVLAMANSVEYGLAASLWTKDIQRVHRMARQLEVGTLWVNTWMMRDLRTPFGGMKMSGLGREGGLHSLEFFTETTHVCVKY